MAKQLSNQGAGRNPSGNPGGLKNAPNPGVDAFAAGKTTPMAGVSKPLTSPGGPIGETGPARRPTPSAVIKGGNPFVDATNDPKGAQVKAPEGAPTATFDSSENSDVVAYGGDYALQQLGQRPGMRPSAAADAYDLVGGGTAGSNVSGTGGLPDGSKGSGGGLVTKPGVIGQTAKGNHGAYGAGGGQLPGFEKPGAF